MSDEKPQRLVCLGLGYTALELGKALLARGVAVAGTVRSPEKAAALSALGFDMHLWADDGRCPEFGLAQGTVLLVSIPPDAAGCPAARAIGHAARGHPVIYLSTTGVYGDRGGDWVDESSAPSPSSERGQRRLEAEQAWQQRGARVAIARLPGIYGPNRSALDRVRDGTARRIVKPGQVFSRIHVSDLAAGLLALIEAGTPAGVYHFADNEPAPPEDPITFAAELLGVAPPPVEDFASATMSPMARSFYAESKRVSSARTRQALTWAPRYPSYREGLRAIHARW